MRVTTLLHPSLHSVLFMWSLYVHRLSLSHILHFCPGREGLPCWHMSLYTRHHAKDTGYPEGGPGSVEGGGDIEIDIWLLLLLLLSSWR